jgi:hypothetical protein
VLGEGASMLSTDLAVTSRQSVLRDSSTAESASRQSVRRDTGSADSTSRLAIGRRDSLAEPAASSPYGGTGYGSTKSAADSGYSTTSRLSRALSTYEEGKLYGGPKIPLLNAGCHKEMSSILADQQRPRI